VVNKLIFIDGKYGLHFGWSSNPKLPLC